MTLQDALTREQRYLKDITLNTLVTGWVNEVLQEIAAECKWPWLRKTATVTFSADNQYAALPEDFMSMEYVCDPRVSGSVAVLEDGQPVQNIVYGTDMAWYEGGMVSGGSGKVRTLRLNPEPTTDYTITVCYYKVPDTVEETSDVLDLPNGADYIFYELLDYKRLDFEEEVDVSIGRHLQRYLGLLRKMRSTFAQRSGKSSPRVIGPLQGRRYYGS